jgi:hypothetical protein
MRYELSKLPLKTLFGPVAAATAALARLDERIARSAVGEGWIARSHFADACASLWVDGELVQLEDLVLHDAGMGIRAPTHELTIAHDVLRTRRRILGHPPGWAVSGAGLRRLRTVSDGAADGSGETDAEPVADARAGSGRIGSVSGSEGDDCGADPLAQELAALDAVLARSDAVLAGRAPAPRRDSEPLVYEPDWDEAQRLDEWRAVLNETEGLPPVLQAALALDAWNQLQVLQHAGWLGRLSSASLLRDGGVATAHLATINLGLRAVPFERRRHRDRNTRLMAMVEGLRHAAELGLKDHDRLLLARQGFERKLAGRRTSSRLPQLIELVLSRPMVSAAMIAEELGITMQGAARIVGELGLRELTGRERFRAWGVI